MVDESRNLLGKLHTRGEELQRGEFHTVVEIYTITADGRILLTQRDAVEVYDAKWAALKELKEMNKRGQIVPPIWERYQLYFKELAILQSETMKMDDSF